MITVYYKNLRILRAYGEFVHGRVIIKSKLPRYYRRQCVYVQFNYTPTVHKRDQHLLYGEQRCHADAVVASVAGKTIGSQVIDTVYMTLTLSSGVVQSPRTQVQFHTSSFSVKRQSVVSSWSFTGRLRRRLNVTRAVQPVATCRQSPYLHKPAIVIVTSSSL